MLLPELKKVAGQLGIEDATSMKKPDLVQAIGDLQAANREAAKAEREARRAERDARRKGGNKNSNNSNNSNSNNSNQNDSDDGENQGSNPNDASDADVNKKEWTGGGNNRNDRNDRHNNRRDRGDRGDRNNNQGGDKSVCVSRDGPRRPSNDRPSNPSHGMVNKRYWVDPGDFEARRAIKSCTFCAAPSLDGKFPPHKYDDCPLMLSGKPPKDHKPASGH